MRGSDFLQRMRFSSALLIPGLAGIAFLAFGGAPASYPLVNCGALLLSTVWIAIRGVTCGPRTRLAAAFGLVAMMALPLLTGPAVDGVARWIPLGPFALHSGMLATPLLVVLAARDPRRGPIMLASAIAAAAFQPDAATAFALFAAAAVLAAVTRRRLWIVTASAGVPAVVASLRVPGPAPQPFVEGIVADAWALQPIAALALMLALVWPVIVLARGHESTRLPRLALSAALSGFVVISLAGPYPVPFLGYGAAPLLGFGLAFAALARFGARVKQKGFAP